METVRVLGPLGEFFSFFDQSVARRVLGIMTPKQSLRQLEIDLASETTRRADHGGLVLIVLKLLGVGIRGLWLRRKAEGKP